MLQQVCLVPTIKRLSMRGCSAAARRKVSKSQPVERSQVNVPLGTTGPYTSPKAQRVAWTYPALSDSLRPGHATAAALCVAEARTQGLQQQVSSRLSEHQGRGRALGDSTLRTDSASEAATGVRSGAGLVRDSAMDGNPGMHASHSREGSTGGRPAAEPAPSNICTGAGEGVPSMPAPDRVQPADYARSREETGAGAGAGMQGPSGRHVSAFARASNVPGAGFVRDSASEETGGGLAGAGRQDSASEQTLAAPTEAAASREVQLGLHLGNHTSAVFPVDFTAISTEGANALHLGAPYHACPQCHDDVWRFSSWDFCAGFPVEGHRDCTLPGGGTRAFAG